VFLLPIRPGPAPEVDAAATSALETSVVDATNDVAPIVGVAPSGTDALRRLSQPPFEWARHVLQ
jgi:hypothetical protein